MTWVKKYKVRRCRGFLFWQWAIELDEQILLAPFSYEDAKTVTGWLNGAYNIGRSDAMLEAEFAKEQAVS